MTRIIAGRAKGRRLSVPTSGTRPTADRVREAMFASIESKLLASGRAWSQVSVCDAWSGSGAIALEAWSRGSNRVVAIESSRAAAMTIQANIAALDAQGVQVIRAKVSHAFQGPPPHGACDVLIGDPPYDDDDSRVRTTLASALAAGWLAPDALVVIERRAPGAQSNRTPPPFPAGIEMEAERTYGDTVLWYGRTTDRREEQPQ